MTFSFRYQMIFLLVLFLTACGSKTFETPEAVGGMLDVSDWEFMEKGDVPLNGEWHFWWKQLISPEEFKNGIPQQDAQTKMVPSYWDDAVGYATYALEIKLPEEHPELGLYLRNAMSAQRLYLVQGEQVGQLWTNGVVATNIEAHRRNHKQNLRSLGFNLDKKITLVWHISNFERSVGGAHNELILNDFQQMQKERGLWNTLIVASLGVILFMGFYHFLLFLQRRSDRASLCFGLFCLATTCFNIVGQRIPDMYFPELTRDYFDLMYMIFSAYGLAGLVSIISTTLFVHYLLPGRVLYLWAFTSGSYLSTFIILIFLAKWNGADYVYADKSFYSDLFLFIVSFSAVLLWLKLNKEEMKPAILLPIGLVVFLFSYFGMLINLVFPIFALLIFIHLVKNAWKGEWVAQALLFSYIILTGIQVNDFLVAYAHIIGIYIGVFGALIFVLFQSFILSRSFSLAFETANRLTVDLRKEVEAQTKSLNQTTKEALQSKEVANALRIKAEEQSRQLAEVDKQKTYFFQNISHELRTPLTLIMSPLEEEVSRHPDNENLVVAKKNSLRLYRLVNQLLDFQKLAAGKKDIKISPVNMVDFARVCGDYVASVCSSRSIDFTTTVNGDNLSKEGSELFIQANIDALEKVVFNYLSNALKYTPDGGLIELGVQEVDKQIRLFVRDTGQGIAQSDQQKLFQTFSQVDGSTKRNYEGTGLGLALVKELVEKMNGMVGLDSELGKGAKFWAQFPSIEPPAVVEDTTFQVKSWLLEDSGEDQADFDDQKTDADVADSGLVMVVDDLQDMRRLIGGLLVESGYRVVTARNGSEAVEKLQSQLPDLIITDWMMPEMTGSELIQAVRKDERTAAIPTILLTAKSDAESKVLGTSIGADAFLGKPFNKQELTSTVRNLLMLKQNEKKVVELNRHLTEKVLKRYLPEDVIEEILEGKGDFDLAPRNQSITILFSDLTGFTNLTAKLRARKMSRILNEYLDAMIEVIFEHGGTIDKFIGDAIMVFWGAPKSLSQEEQVERATACAKEMQLRLVELNQSWGEDGIPYLNMRIGINHGPAIVGNFGNKRRSDYSAIGSNINLASRIESACTPGEIFLSGNVCDLMEEDTFEEAGRFDLKGIGEVDLYRLVSGGEEQR